MGVVAWKLMLAFAWIAQAVSPTPAPADASPISAVYSWAQLLALLTDRALWLFFLGLIIYSAVLLQKKKDKDIAAKDAELVELRKWQKDKIVELAVTVKSNTDAIQDQKEVSQNLIHLLELLERKL